VFDPDAPLSFDRSGNTGSHPELIVRGVDNALSILISDVATDYGYLTLADVDFHTGT
jgi:hypothetical protein